MIGDEMEISAFFNQEKHFLIMTTAGKPVYSL